jgi:hypothetical protein
VRGNHGDPQLVHSVEHPLELGPLVWRQVLEELGGRLDQVPSHRRDPSATERRQRQEHAPAVVWVAVTGHKPRLRHARHQPRDRGSADLEPPRDLGLGCLAGQRDYSHRVVLLV